MSTRRGRRSTKNLVAKKKMTTDQYKNTQIVARREARKVFNRNTETKKFDGSLAHNGANVDYNGVIYAVTRDVSAGTQIVQGTEENEYIGTTIKPVHLQIRFAMSPGDSTNLVTVVVLQMKGLFNPVGDQMTNILQSTGNSTAPLSPFDRAYQDRFRVLYRKTFSLSSQDISIQSHSIQIGYSKLAKLFFQDDAGAIESNGIFLGFISDSSAAVHPLIRAAWRLHYKDT